MEDSEKVAKIIELLGAFVERGTYTSGEAFYTVYDHYYLDTDFFPDLFKILDE